MAWLVVESDSAGDMGAAARTLARAWTRSIATASSALYRIGGDTAGCVSAPAARTALIAHLAWLAMLLVGAPARWSAGWPRSTPNGCAATKTHRESKPAPQRAPYGTGAVGPNEGREGDVAEQTDSGRQ